MNRIKTSYLTPLICEKIFALAIETGLDYGTMGAKIIGRIPSRKCSPQLRYHYADLMDTAHGQRAYCPELERIRTNR